MQPGAHRRSGWDGQSAARERWGLGTSPARLLHLAFFRKSSHVMIQYNTRDMTSRHVNKPRSASRRPLASVPLALSQVLTLGAVGLLGADSDSRSGDSAGWHRHMPAATAAVGTGTGQ